MSGPPDTPDGPNRPAGPSGRPGPVGPADPTVANEIAGERTERVPTGLLDAATSPPEPEVKHSALVGYMSVPVHPRFPIRRSTLLLAVAFVGFGILLYLYPPRTAYSPGSLITGANGEQLQVVPVTSTTTTTVPSSTTTTTTPVRPPPTTTGPSPTTTTTTTTTGTSTTQSTSTTSTTVPRSSGSTTSTVGGASGAGTTTTSKP